MSLAICRGLELVGDAALIEYVLPAKRRGVVVFVPVVIRREKLRPAWRGGVDDDVQGEGGRVGISLTHALHEDLNRIIPD